MITQDHTWTPTEPIPTGELKRIIEAKRIAPICQHYWIFQLNGAALLRGCSLCGRADVSVIVQNGPLPWLRVEETR